MLTLGYALQWSVGSAWLIPPTVVLAFTACIAKHNHVHCPVFRSRRANRAMDLWLTVLTGTSTAGIRVAHQVRHHGRNQSPDDHVRTTIVGNSQPLRALLLFVPLVVRETWRWQRVDLQRSRRRPLRRALAAERAALTALVVISCCADWRHFLVTFPLPWLAGQWLLVAVNLPQHDGCDSDSRWAHSRNVVGSLANWIFLNNGFHTAHHEQPGLHWSRLPALHAAAVRPNLPPPLELPSFAALWVAWWRDRRQRLDRRAFPADPFS
jgi:fatty acid desaturase